MWSGCGWGWFHHLAAGPGWLRPGGLAPGGRGPAAAGGAGFCAGPASRPAGAGGLAGVPPSPWSLERGLGNWPLFFDDLSLSVFLDAGAAGSPLDLNQLRFSLGAELRLGLTLFYQVPAGLLLGGAQGLGEPGPRLYLGLVWPGL